tara:strand:- start:8395 stop:8613 length:219 start_codon:yes stop_codon:yes gene_type:complete
MSKETFQELKQIFGSIDLKEDEMVELNNYCKELEEKLEQLRFKNIEIENSEKIFENTIFNLDKLFAYIVDDK